MCLAVQPLFSNSFSSDCTCGKRNRYLRSRIVGGTQAKKHEFPWIALILKLFDESEELPPSLRGRFETCGGSLISNQHILTAAHCTHDIEGGVRYDPTAIITFLGKQKNFDQNTDLKNFVKVLRVINHPNYGKKLDDIFDYSNNYDFAILKISPVEFSRKISPVCLATNSFEAHVGEVGTVAGWGKEGENATVASSTLLSAEIAHYKSKRMPR